MEQIVSTLAVFRAVSEQVSSAQLRTNQNSAQLLDSQSESLPSQTARSYLNRLYHGEKKKAILL